MTIKPSEMMKHICLPILCAACAFVSCVSRQVAEQTVEQRDSLEAVVRAKDSLIEVVFADINAVTENLARIRTRETLVALARNDEGVRRPIEEIDAAIAAIDRLLQETRQKIAALQRSSAQLREGGLRISGQSPDGELTEFVELPQDVHPFYVATQAHPEFKSRPTKPHPLFAGLVKAALDHQAAR